MDDSWVPPKLIIGSVATADYYYQRKKIEHQIWVELKKGTNILLSAPRRVGKTSIMQAIKDFPEDNFKLIFQNIQGINDDQVFYKTLYELILNCLSRFKTNREKIQNYFKTIKLSEIGAKSVKIGIEGLNYLEEINKIIPQLDKDGETVVVLLDELPEVLHALHLSGKDKEAVAILKNLRYWRQQPEFQKLKFILAGSIGIHHVVGKVSGRSSDINDLVKVSCPALEEGEFFKYVNWSVKEATMQFDEGVMDYLKDKIVYHVPYFINLMLDRLDKNAIKAKNSVLTVESVDQAFDEVEKNNSYFNDWRDRLKKYLSKTDFQLVNKVLITIAHKDEIAIQKIYNIAQEFNRTEDYMDLISDLMEDGYIKENNQKYQFISPFLKSYWKRANPIFE